MNPIPVNSSNVVQFGFTASFDLENSNLKFDISAYTIFTTGGAANVQGINFQVIDPSGSELSSIDFPSVDINPGAGETTYQVQLSNSPSQFGWYTIKGVLRDQTGLDYVIEFAKNICKPVGQVNGIVPGVLKDHVDCSVPMINIGELTNLTYQTLAPANIVKTGMFYYPQGTLPPVAFTYTPFEIFGSGKIYTGDYTVKLKTVATYDMGDLCFVIVTYGSTLNFSVTCNSTLCEVMCCIEKLQNIVADGCSSAQAQDARKKLDQAIIPLIMAITMEKCGQDSGEMVQEISDILGCDCQCDGQAVEARPIYSLIDPVVLQGQCGTTANLVGGIWVIKSKTVTVNKLNPTDPAFLITTEQTDCNYNVTIGLNYDALTGTVLNVIKNSPQYVSILNSLITIPPLDLSGIGPNCVIDLSSCDYDLITDASNVAKLVTSIVIGGTIYAAPSGLNITNALGIATWLNSLNRGIFTVYYDSTTNPATTVVSTDNNPNSVSTMAFSLNGSPLVQQFSKSCASAEDMFKAIIDYLCGLSDDNIHLSQPYTICTLQTDGSIKSEQVSPSGENTLATLLLKYTIAFCASLANVKALAAINCTNIKNVFTDTVTTIVPATDGLYGSRGGNCGVWSIEDTVRQVLTFLSNTNKQDIIDQFCFVVSRCVVPVCQPVSFMEIELIEPCPAVSGITGSFTT